MLRNCVVCLETEVQMPPIAIFISCMLHNSCEWADLIPVYDVAQSRLEDKERREVGLGSCVNDPPSVRVIYRRVCVIYRVTITNINGDSSPTLSSSFSQLL